MNSRQLDPAWRQGHGAIQALLYGGLGWKVQDDYKISVFFVPHGGSIVGFYGRDGLAGMVGVSPDASGFSGIVFTYVVRREERVDEILDEAKKAGGTILKPAAKLKWGRYGGSSSPTPMATSGTSATAPKSGPALRRVARDR